MTNLQIALVTYREKNNLTQPEFAKIINCKREALANWETGRSIPRPNMLKKISEIINVNTDYLLGLTDIKNISLPKEKHPSIDDIEVAFYNQHGIVTEEQKKEVESFIKYIRSREDK